MTAGTGGTAAAERCPGCPAAPQRLAAGNTKLREENDRLRGQLQAIRQLAEQAVATGLVDGQALLDAAGAQQ